MSGSASATFGAVSALLTTLMAALTWVGVQRTKAATRNVDAIRVTQDVQTETITRLDTENTELRKRVRRLEEEHAACQHRLERIMLRLRSMGISVDAS